MWDVTFFQQPITYYVQWCCPKGVINGIDVTENYIAHSLRLWKKHAILLTCVTFLARNSAMASIRVLGSLLCCISCSIKLMLMLWGDPFELILLIFWQDEQPDVQGLGATLVSGRVATDSPVGTIQDCSTLTPAWHQSCFYCLECLWAPSSLLNFSMVQCPSFYAFWTSALRIHICGPQLVNTCNF